MEGFRCQDQPQRGMTRGTETRWARLSHSSLGPPGPGRGCPRRAAGEQRAPVHPDAHLRLRGPEASPAYGPGAFRAHRAGARVQTGDGESTRPRFPGAGLLPLDALKRYGHAKTFIASQRQKVSRVQGSNAFLRSTALALPQPILPTCTKGAGSGAKGCLRHGRSRGRKAPVRSPPGQARLAPCLPCEETPAPPPIVGPGRDRANAGEGKGVAKQGSHAERRVPLGAKNDRANPPPHKPPAFKSPFICICSLFPVSAPKGVRSDWSPGVCTSSSTIQSAQ